MLVHKPWISLLGALCFFVFTCWWPSAAWAETASCRELFNRDPRYAALFEDGKLLSGAWFKKPESDTIIVFVHGIFSNNRDAWLSEDEKAGCPYWPELLTKDELFKGVGVFVASYYTSLSSGNFDIEQASNQLITVLKNASNGHPYSPLQYRNIVFVSHSLGGVVTRNALLKEWRAFRLRNLGLILMASPAKGSGWADRAASISELLNNKMALQLRSDDPILDRIHTDFAALVRSDADGQRIKGMEQFENKFFSECGFFCRSATFTLRNVVSPSDGGGYFGAPQIVPDTDHSTLVKPTSRNDESHVRLRLHFQQNFLASVRSFSPEKGVGKFVLVGETPIVGWRTIQKQTLRLTAYEGGCSNSLPQGCMSELPGLPVLRDPPAIGDRRWFPVGEGRVKLLSGSARTYEFREQFTPFGVRLWASLNQNLRPPSVEEYERDFELQEYGEVRREMKTFDANLCGEPGCTVPVTVPGGIQLTKLLEDVPVGVKETEWKGGQPVIGNVVRLTDYNPLPEGGMQLTFKVIPDYANGFR